MNGGGLSGSRGLGVGGLGDISGLICFAVILGFNCLEVICLGLGRFREA